MALRFISHKEIAFRQLLGLLRTPPVAVMGYYSNLFLSAKFVLGDQPDKLKYLDKEIHKVECMVGVQLTPESDSILQELAEIAELKQRLESEKRNIESTSELVQEEDQKNLSRIQSLYKEVTREIAELDRQEYNLTFKLTPLMGLKELETYMDNNMDLKSYFNENGKIVTQMQLSAELDRIKNWVYQEAVELMPYIRFTKLE